MIFVDTETKPVEKTPERERHELWFGEALFVRIQTKDGKEYRHEEWLHFENADTFWDWVVKRTRKRSKTYIFAHNWNFDGSILYTASSLRKRGYRTLQYINGGPPFILRVKSDNNTLALVDTLNYFTTSLEALGESIGIPKKAMPDYDDPFEDWTAYCRRDVEVLRDAMLAFRSFVEVNDLGNFRPTLASQAFNAFRHRFYSGGILIHDDQKTLELEREGYYGGRVECFRLGTFRRKFYYLDVNSLYPSVMVDNEYPKQLVRSRRAVPVKDMADYLTDYACVGAITVRTDEPIYPVRMDGRLCFPVGDFDTVLCTPELAYALEHGHITKVKHLTLYEKGEVFTDYVETLYGLRQEYAASDNPAFKFMCKIMLNSLYGKFGQRGQQWEEVRPSEPDDPLDWLEEEWDGGPVARYRVRLGNVQKLSRNEESRESFPAISAHVTAYARILMWNLIKKAGPKHVYYTDTDSLVVDSVGYRNLSGAIHPTQLGYLKVEKTANVARFLGPKDYHFGDDERHKGIRKNATRLADNKWEQIQFHSWDWHMKRGEEGFIYIDTITKTLHRQYKKGTIDARGIVSPYQLTAADET